MGVLAALFAGMLGYKVLHAGGLEQTALFYVELPATLALVVAGTARPRSATGMAVAIVGSAWAVAVLPAVNLLAVRQEWWSFDVDGGTVVGLPVDLMLGWILIGATLLLARWTERDERLLVRVLAQLNLVGVLLLALPVVALGPALGVAGRLRRPRHAAAL